MLQLQDDRSGAVGRKQGPNGQRRSSSVELRVKRLQLVTGMGPNHRVMLETLWRWAEAETRHREHSRALTTRGHRPRSSKMRKILSTEARSMATITMIILLPMPATTMAGQGLICPMVPNISIDPLQNSLNRRKTTTWNSLQKSLQRGQGGQILTSNCSPKPPNGTERGKNDGRALTASKAPSQRIKVSWPKRSQ